MGITINESEVKSGRTVRMCDIVAEIAKKLKVPEDTPWEILVHLHQLRQEAEMRGGILPFPYEQATHISGITNLEDIEHDDDVFTPCGNGGDAQLPLKKNIVEDDETAERRVLAILRIKGSVTRKYTY